MSAILNPQLQQSQQDPDAFTRLGGWLFRQRTLVPLPIAAALLLAPSRTTPRFLPWAGLALVVLGELLRLWGVRHIGVISRTRSDRLGPLVESGPFGLVRNPLYLGNMALWIGFAMSARVLYLVPFVLVALAVTYHAIVRWEEGLLQARRGEAFQRYASRVPRWVPKMGPVTHGGAAPAGAFSWRETFFSERGTLIAIGVGYALLALKQQLLH